MTTKEQVLQKCTVNGLIVKLPDTQLDRPLYVDVKNALEKIGGKWKGGKIQGFVFAHDPASLLAEISNGVKRNLKQEFQFFETPPGLADKMVKMAEIKEGMCVLEPSAGCGAIIQAIYKAFPYYMQQQNDPSCVTVNYYELMDQNLTVISKMCSQSQRWGSSTSCLGQDFLKSSDFYLYDRIIANPPFTKNQDIDHILKMYSILNSGGILVTLASMSWTFGETKKQKAFRKWIDEVGAYKEELPENTFKESGTSVKTILLKIIKQ